MVAPAVPRTGRRVTASARRRRWILPLVGLTAVVLATSCAAPAQRDTDVVVRFGDNFSPSHPITANGSLYFVERLRETGPAVGLDVEFYPSGQLGAFEDVPTLLSSGVSDIAGVVPAYLSAQMPLSSAFDLPGYTSDSCVGAKAVTRAISEGSTTREEEIAPLGLRPLWSVLLTGYELMTSEIATDPNSQEGAILRSPGGAVDRVVDEMGAAGVSMPLSDMYEAISRGTVDGTVASPTSMAPYKLAEVLRHSTIGAELGSVTVLYSMSDEKWSELNDAQREVITEAAADTENHLCHKLNELLPESRRQMAEDGTTLDVLSPQQQATWTTQISEPAREQWRADLSDMGLPAGDVLDQWESALREEGYSND